MTSSSLHKNQLVDKNLPFLINDNACTQDFGEIKGSKYSSFSAKGFPKGDVTEEYIEKSDLDGSDVFLLEE